MRGNNANLGNFDRRITTQALYKPGEKMFGPSPVAAPAGHSPYICEYMYVLAGEELDPGEVVKLDTTSTTTIAQAKVVKTSNSANDTHKVVGVVPQGLIDAYGKPATLVASGSYFWLVIRGVVKVLDSGTATAGDLLTASTGSGNEGKVASAAGTGLGLGQVLVDKDPAGLTVALFKSPLA